MNVENSNEIPLVDKDYLLQKMPGKGGWTFALLPEISADKNSYFGLVKVKGTIDDYEIDNINLMPMGNGNLFLSVKADIRKAIGKNEGDWVHIKLYSLNLPKVKHDDFYVCLQEDEIAFKNFNHLSEIKQKELIDWIFLVKNDELKIERIAQTLENLTNMTVKKGSYKQ